eukprot:gene11276-13325_t
MYTAFMIAHGGIAFSGVMITIGQDLIDCGNSSDESDAQCGDNDSDSESDCGKLWGFIKPTSLPSLIVTVGAVINACTAPFLGAIIECTPYRNRFGAFGSSMCLIGVLMSAVIIVPNEDTLAVCAVGSVLTYAFKDLHVLVGEAYIPELSPAADEVATAVTAGGLWLYCTEMVVIAVITIIGSGMTTSHYGFFVTIVCGLPMILLLYLIYSKYPQVPAAHKVPAGQTIVSFSLSRLKILTREMYRDYQDLGILLLANMCFDPALSGLFSVAVQVLIGKYKFTPAEVPIVLGCAILSAVPGVVASRACARAPANADTNAPKACPSPADVASLRRTQLALIGSLLMVATITSLATVALSQCALGIACVFGALWGFFTTFCWNSSSMMRAALVPGGREAEVSGLAFVAFNLLQWLPTLIFSIANETWNIDGALLLLNIFFVSGIAVLACIDVERGLRAKVQSLGQRRWHGGHSGEVKSTGETELPSCNTINEL